VAARDVVVAVRPRGSAEGCDWSNVGGRVPEREGTVRMALLRGSWTIDALEPMRSRVTYQIAVQPGGMIPGWLVRRGAIDALPRVIDQLRHCLSRSSGTRCRAERQ
jgi:hypothetical protein